MPIVITVHAYFRDALISEPAIIAPQPVVMIAHAHSPVAWTAMPPITMPPPAAQMHLVIFPIALTFQHAIMTPLQQITTIAFIPEHPVTMVIPRPAMMFSRAIVCVKDKLAHNLDVLTQTH
jgi:hypothetical protein